MTRTILTLAVLLVATGCTRYDPMPRWTGYALEDRR